MFGYEDLETYEDELYREESSSEAEIDSDVEFQLYSQVHYANNLTGEKTGRERGPTSLDREAATVKGKSSGRTKKAIVISDSDVIVISDSPDVIVLSDTEDNSVYSCKGIKSSECKLSERKKQSIEEPAQGSAKQAHHRCRRSPQIQETMMMIKGSESSEEEDESIESWMVLGHDQEEENDDDIQLNIEDYKTSSNKVLKDWWCKGDLRTHWLICEKDLKPFQKQRSRYYAPNTANIDCRNCGKLGHISKFCPSPKKLPACCLCGVRGHFQRCCPERYCTNCNMPGHWFQNCIERACWKKQCHRCQMTGHYADACPEIWRQYHLTIHQGSIVNGCPQSIGKKSTYCYNCARSGHFGYECSGKWMHNHTFPTSPFVYHYDTKRDIQMRERRIKKRVEALQEAGFLETRFLTPRLRTGKCASEDSFTKKAKKKMKREALKKKRMEQEGREFTRNRGAAKRKAKRHHRTTHCPKTFTEGVEEDFPRGFAAQSVAISAPEYKTQQSPLLFMHSNITQNEGHLGPTRRKRNKIRKKKKHTGETIELARKRRKKTKKTKAHVSEEVPPDPDNASIMEQKSKKRKKHSKIKSQESVN
ncbi:zinc finger CCHC domain-containing protein 7 [Scyliorhinus canicula]|uniref:zinc finger CCHC domain-containing protein 7 n=1 Tax=Scyliorhinus canicula TaxID=7830 RepID=UPI0018F5E64A|nr:zinc finger CCHC domain-containing protein 7 [Scyliorhinus canicula]